MSSNTFRIHIGESAKPYLEPKYIDDLNESLSFFEDKIFSVEMQPSAGKALKVGKKVDLTNNLNILAVDFNSPELKASGWRQECDRIFLWTTKKRTKSINNG